MFSCFFKMKFKRFSEILLPNPFLILCLLYNPVFGSATRYQKNSSNVGDILLNIFGGPFAVVSSQDEASSACQEHSKLYLQALANMTPWAINMYDASTKIPSGLVTGNVQQLGNYDQCLRIEVQNGDVLAFRGQQCRATIHFEVTGEDSGNRTRTDTRRSLDMKDLFYAALEAAGVYDWKDTKSAPYVWAFCVPSSCSTTDVQRALQKSLSPLTVPGRVEAMVSVTSSDCHVADPTGTQLSAADLGILVLLAVVLVFLIASTSYDLIVSRKYAGKKSKGVAHSVLVSFSLTTNGRNLLSCSTSSDTMPSLNGLRFISIFWILLGHTYYMKSVSSNINNIVVKHFDQSLSMMLIMNGTLTTDTFFLLSGILLAYVFMRDRQKKQPFNLATFYIHRYLRLTPPYAFVIFFYATLLSRLGSGPLWDTWAGANRDYCVANWWTNLLYINNYINLDQMCLNQTWYLAVDMQLFWLSPLLLYPLARWPRFGKGLLAFVIFLSIIIPFAITFAERLTAVMLYNKDLLPVAAVYSFIYTKTYARAGPYLIGIALGYLLHVLRNKHISIPMVRMYFSSHAVSAGPVNAFLSWRLFVPLSRLTYSAYLCHYVVLLYNAGSIRAPGYLSEYTVVHEFAGNLMFTLVLAAVISLAFEVPFMNLDRIVIKRQPRDATPTAKGVSIVPAAGNAVQPSGFHSNTIHQDNREGAPSVYVISEKTSLPVVQLKSYENKAFDGGR
ncbi:nose resistant to fluoxetine protein 6 isoform X3 [Cryptotermes secundus]|uniref:nose resistant to fluoxetine protein 6 isoform X3 n=1 Tax=Cryptotermes secundus TaxID=105785 RepID=UPI000CD7C9BE|nr:nose resistant to fluoxetine protein 6 isoform X3 [Cryptotermes secundus]